MRVFWKLRSSYFSDCTLSALGSLSGSSTSREVRAFLSVDAVLSKGYFSLGLRTLPEVLGFWAPKLREAVSLASTNSARILDFLRRNWGPEMSQ